MSSTITLDERDSAILAERVTSLELVEGPRVGDFVHFADGVVRRISFVTPPAWLPECDSVQTSDGGSFYLGNGYLSFSGSLYLGVKHVTLTLTNEARQGSAWFFHHDYACADNGVRVSIEQRVFECSAPATR